MSAAQVLNSAMLPVSTSARPSPSDGARYDRGDTSFRDALDSASRSSDAPASSSSRSASSSERATAERKDASNEDPADTGEHEDDPAQSSEEGAKRTDQGSVNGLSLILAALEKSVEPSNADTSGEFAEALATLKTGEALVRRGDVTEEKKAEVQEDGPLLPSEDIEGGDELDAAKLLALLKNPEASEAIGVDALADAPRAEPPVEIKVTVLGQEKHLALEQMPSDAVASLGKSTEAAQTEEAIAAPEGEQVAQQAAKAGAGAGEAFDRVRTEMKTDSSTREAETGASRRDSSPTVEARGQSSSAVAEQAIGAHADGRQQDSRGASGGNSQQQGANSFVSMLNAAQASRPVDETSETTAGYEPLSDQIAREVRAELRADGLGESSSEGVVKVLSIELKPANLGSVTVRLALKDNAITVHIETQRRETLAVIERERDALVGALSSAGYSVDGVTTGPQNEASRLSVTQSGFGGSGSAGSQGAPQGQFGQGLANSSGGQGRQENGSFGRQDTPAPADGKDASNSGIRRSAEGLYV